MRSRDETFPFDVDVCVSSFNQIAQTQCHFVIPSIASISSILAIDFGRVSLYTYYYYFFHLEDDLHEEGIDLLHPIVLRTTTECYELLRCTMMEKRETSIAIGGKNIAKFSFLCIVVSHLHKTQHMPLSMFFLFGRNWWQYKFQMLKFNSPVFLFPNISIFRILFFVAASAASIHESCLASNTQPEKHYSACVAEIETLCNVN